jgi:hypothetical protein
VAMKSSVFWDMTLCSLAAFFTLLSGLAYSLTVKMEIICSSKTLVDVHWTTQCYVPEDITLHRLTAFERRVPRRIFGCKGEVTKRWQILHMFCYSNLILG